MAVKSASKVPPKNNTSTSGTTAIPTVSHPKSPAHQATRWASSGRFVRAKSCARKDKIIPAIASGIVKPIFYEYVKEKNLQQVAHGIYVSEDTWIDAMFLLHLRCGQAVFSHESALFFHDLTDREPSPYAITVRRGYSTTRLKAEGLSVYTIKPELYEVGLTTGQTPFGHTVPVYDMERTICDLLRSRSSMEIQTFQGALKMYARRKDKDLRTLMRYAGMFRVEKILRQYLEVLL